MVQFACCMRAKGEQRAPNERNYAERAFAITNQPRKDTCLACPPPVSNKRKLTVGLLDVPVTMPQSAG